MKQIPTSNAPDKLNYVSVRAGALDRTCYPLESSREWHRRRYPRCVVLIGETVRSKLILIAIVVVGFLALNAFVHSSLEAMGKVAIKGSLKHP